MNTLKYEKQYFCDKCKYAKNGIKVVTGRNNPFYAEGADRKAIKSYWKKRLDTITAKYNTEQSTEVFFKDVQSLMKTMNSEFPNGFARGKFHYIDALRSISVILKYRWCKEDQYPNYPMPPRCPISKPILRTIGSNYSEYVDNQIKKKDVLSIYSEFQIEANKQDPKDISIWELRTYNKITR